MHFAQGLGARRYHHHHLAARQTLASFVEIGIPRVGMQSLPEELTQSLKLLGSGLVSHDFDPVDRTILNADKPPTNVEALKFSAACRDVNEQETNDSATAPEAAIDSFTSGSILLALRSEVGLDGGARPHWLLATAGQVAVLEAGRQPRWVHRIALSQCEAFRVKAAVGSGFVQVRRDGLWVDLLRYTNRQGARFGDGVRQLEKLRKGVSPQPLVDSLEATTSDRDDQSNQRILSRVWQLLRPYRGATALMFGLSLIAVSVELAPPMLQKVLVDRVLKLDQPKPPVDGLISFLLLLVVALAAMRLVTAAIGVWKGRISSWVGTALTADLRAKMVEKLHRLPVGYHDRQQVGMLMSRVSYDTETMHTLMHQVSGGFILQCLQLLGIGVMLFYLNPKLAFYTMLPMPLVVAGSWFFTRHLHPRHNRYWDSVGRQAAALTGMLSGIRVVKSFAQEPREYDRFQKSSHRLRDSRRQVDFLNATFTSLIGFVFGLGALIVWYVGGRDVIGEQMTLGSLMAFIAYLAMFYTPLTSLTESTTWISQFLSASKRVFDLLDTPSEITEAEAPLDVPEVEGKVQFQNVSFSFDDQQVVLKNLTFEIRPGEMIGIVGRSGSGKSTLLSLISRMYDPTAGQVQIDGQDIRSLQLPKLRQHVGVVLQESFLFEGPIEANIAYGNPDALPEQILAAAAAASAHNFVLRMPFAYETTIGERGAGLSGGERQRLSIARALLYDPRILILDEATSSVDTESERAIQEALRRFAKGRTTIAVAHRLSTLRDAHRLFVLDQGRLIEQGTHDELLAQGGVYASLVHIQTGMHSAAKSLQSATVGEGAGATPEFNLDLDADPGQEPTWNRSAQQTHETKPMAGCAPFTLRWLEPGNSRIYSGVHNVASVQVGEDQFSDITAIRAFPSRHAEQFLSVQCTDEHGSLFEVGMIRTLADWPDDAQQVIRECLKRRYLLRTILELQQLRPERNLLRCVALTDAGEMAFSLPLEDKAVKMYGAHGRLLTDTDDNHYLIPNVRDLTFLQQRIFQWHFAD